MAGRINENAIIVKQNESFGFYCVCKRNGEVVDLTGASAVLTVANSSGEQILQIASEELWEGVDLKDGTLWFKITEADTKNIPVGEYIADIQLTEASGEVNTIWPVDVSIVGTFTVTPNIHSIVTGGKNVFFG